MSKIISSLEQASKVLTDNGIKLYTFEVDARYDLDLGQMWFNDFKEELKDKSLFLGRNSTDYLVIFESEKLKDAPYYKVSHLRKMRKDALYSLAENYDYYGVGDESSKQDIIDVLMGISNEQYYNHHFNESSFHDLEHDFDVTGYCQGDKILVKFVGKVEYYNESNLTNLFYDTPKTIKINVLLNGEEHEERSLDQFEGFKSYDYYEKDEIIKFVSEKFNAEYLDLLLEHLENELPKSLEYK